MLPYKTPNVVFRNLGGGKFEELTDEAGPAITEAHSSRGAAFGDFDNDGDVDILIVNMNEPPSLLRNDMSGTDHWLKVLLVGTASNRSAIGAQVVATYGERKQAQAVLAQSLLPVGQRSAAAFRAGSGGEGQPGDSVAEWGTRKRRGCGRGSVGGDPRRSGDRSERAVPENEPVSRYQTRTNLCDSLQILQPRNCSNKSPNKRS